MKPPNIPKYLMAELISHKRKVCSLYKRAVRNHMGLAMERQDAAYNRVILRARFEEHRHEKDMRKAKELLRLGEEELNTYLDPWPLIFAEEPGGCAHERDPIRPDWLLDAWHPEEKAAYPDYFARREQRKKEFVEFWNKQYGGPTPEKDAEKML